MPAAYTHKLSVQVSDFKDIGLLIQLARLVCDFCSSSQRFACGFLQIPPRDGHPCRPANDSPCRVRRRLSLPSKSALPGATNKKQVTRESHLLSSKRLYECLLRLLLKLLLDQQLRQIRDDFPCDLADYFVRHHLNHSSCDDVDHLGSKLTG